eukprot:CAMPEP_0170559630 /NCGR_PEP_ID=MMETSP0211-20121228/44109_1 /TAXON_ID=311385 /ORGANISM="Pseudokeronopsis sp., Strain OXSARD2" /LENGTH=33 /DNA_ID= /DNA_START= /DNA_END= /DNA_ORIENTATION=
MKRYAMEDSISIDNIKGFLEDYKAGKLKPHFMS